MTLESEATDDQTLTRTELLRMRAYPPDMIAGANGDRPEPDTAACVVCSATIAERRQQSGSKTCGKESCADAWRKRRRTASDAKRRAAASRSPTERPEPVTATNGTNDGTPALNGSASEALLPALLAVGAVRSITLEIAGEAWLMTRQ